MNTRYRGVGAEVKVGIALARFVFRLQIVIISQSQIGEQEPFHVRLAVDELTDATLAFQFFTDVGEDGLPVAVVGHTCHQVV